MLSFLLTIDRRVQIVILPFITLSVHYLLATFLSAEKRRSLNRRMRQLIMSDFLIVAGILSTLTPLMRYTALGSASAELFDIARILDAIELAGDEDLTGYDRLMRSVSPALSVMIVGCVLRFGTFPFTRDGREMWNGTAPAIRLIFWFYGPILGTAVLLRECQLFPIVCYRMFPILSYVWIAGLLWLAFSSRSRRNYNNDTQSFLFISTMLILALGGPNTTSIAGAMLLLLAIGLKSSIPQQLRIDRFSAAWLCHWAFHVMLASGMILAVVGTWQSTGPGSRELGAVLLVGLSIILLRRNVKNSSSSGETTSTPDRVLDRFSRQAPVVRGEIPVWEFVENPPSSPRRSGIQTALILFAAVVFLLIPQLIWTHVRWDLQKIQFPDSSGGFALGENPK
jgi:hypothetical protein